MFERYDQHAADPPLGFNDERPALGWGTTSVWLIHSSSIRSGLRCVGSPESMILLCLLPAPGSSSQARRRRTRVRGMAHQQATRAGDGRALPHPAVDPMQESRIQGSRPGRSSSGRGLAGLLRVSPGPHRNLCQKNRASRVPATKPPTGNTSEIPRDAANSTPFIAAASPSKVSGSTLWRVTFAANSATDK